MFMRSRLSSQGLRRALLFSALAASAASADEGRSVAVQFPAASETELHWGYADTVGPSHWGEIPGAAACAIGVSETPVALETARSVPDSHAAPDFNYRPTRVHMLNNGHTVEFTYDAGSSLRVDGREYTLAQFHFHTPSEHIEDGKRFPLELHMVHKDAQGRIVVVGIFIKQGEHNRALEKAFSHLPWSEGEHSDLPDAVINASALLPRNKTYFHYQGSLTTPPCTEGVEWYVMKNSIELSDAQIAAFQRLPHMNPNSRPLQPLNGRTVYLHTSYR